MGFAATGFPVGEATVDLLRAQKALRDWAYEHGAEAIACTSSGGFSRGEAAVAWVSYRLGGRTYAARLSVMPMAGHAMSVTRPGKRM